MDSPEFKADAMTRAEHNATPIEGVPYGFWETGTEGVLWTVQANWRGPSWRYEDMHYLEDGDHLTIRDAASGQVLFTGKVKLSDELNVQTIATDWFGKPLGYSYKAQVINGRYVHGVQEGVDPALWFEWFMESLDSSRVDFKTQTGEHVARYLATLVMQR
jgi:hypothetical protein